MGGRNCKTNRIKRIIIRDFNDGNFIKKLNNSNLIKVKIV